MFSDKSMFAIINPRAQKVRRPSLVSRYKQKFTVTNVKHLASVMVWGFFNNNGSHGSIFFHPLKMAMNSDCYVTMLNEKLFRFMEIYGAMHFLRNKDPCKIQQEGHGIPEGEEGHCDGLAKQLALPKPNIEREVDHQEEVEGQSHHHITAKATRSHHEAVVDVAQ
jgi:hypothetical protein